jgi:hypothetical protein
MTDLQLSLTITNTDELTRFLTHSGIIYDFWEFLEKNAYNIDYKCLYTKERTASTIYMFFLYKIINNEVSNTIISHYIDLDEDAMFATILEIEAFYNLHEEAASNLIEDNLFKIDISKNNETIDFCFDTIFTKFEVIDDVSFVEIAKNFFITSELEENLYIFDLHDSLDSLDAKLNFSNFGKLFVKSDIKTDDDHNTNLISDVDDTNDKVNEKQKQKQKQKQTQQDIDDQELENVLKGLKINSTVSSPKRVPGVNSLGKKLPFNSRNNEHYNAKLDSVSQKKDSDNDNDTIDNDTIDLINSKLEYISNILMNQSKIEESVIGSNINQNTPRLDHNKYEVDKVDKILELLTIVNLNKFSKDDITLIVKLIGALK